MCNVEKIDLGSITFFSSCVCGNQKKTQHHILPHCMATHIYCKPVHHVHLKVSTVFKVCSLVPKCHYWF